jgi:hypothetical protein
LPFTHCHEKIKVNSFRKYFGAGMMFLAVAGLGPATVHAASPAARSPTFCNPLDLAYRFQPSAPSRREAADPDLVRFKGEYWLFASKSGGYWHSRDLAHWEFIQPTGLPLEDYAPAIEIISGRMFFTAFDSKAIFTTDDPAGGVWIKAADYAAPALFADDDGRVYVYFGCARNGKIQVVELDPANHFKVVRSPKVCLPTDYVHHGWEVMGEKNRGVKNVGGTVQMAPFTEGAWMTKHGGTYYLQYSAPGTEVQTYADGVYTDKTVGCLTRHSTKCLFHWATLRIV